MWSLTRLRQHDACRCLRDLLEDAPAAGVPSAEQQAHLAGCTECQAFADDLLMSRAILRDVPVAAPGPWFAPRVMAAIAAANRGTAAQASSDCLRSRSGAEAVAGSLGCRTPVRRAPHLDLRSGAAPGSGLAV